MSSETKLFCARYVLLAFWGLVSRVLKILYRVFIQIIKRTKGLGERELFYFTSMDSQKQ